MTDLQSHLTNWTAHVGGLRLGLALWLVVATLVAWGLGPALTIRPRRWLWSMVSGTWVVAEGLIHRGDLMVIPVGRLIGDWPARIGNWTDDPLRWATPLEALLTVAVALTIWASARGAIGSRRR